MFCVVKILENMRLQTNKWNSEWQFNIAMSSDGKHQIAIGMGCVYSSHNYGNLFRISNSNNSLFDNIYLSIISMQNGKYSELLLLMVQF